jgi:hypothetical protein
VTDRRLDKETGFHSSAHKPPGKFGPSESHRRNKLSRTFIAIALAALLLLIVLAYLA